MGLNSIGGGHTPFFPNIQAKVDELKKLNKNVDEIANRFEYHQVTHHEVQTFLERDFPPIKKFQDENELFLKQNKGNPEVDKFNENLKYLESKVINFYS